MENYIVSARKYRPDTFDSVVGQSALTTTLKNAIASGKLAHAYLFCGPRGVGKTTCARIFAKTINCTNPLPNGEACNECESCKAFNEQRSLNIHELDAASNNGVDQIRLLIEQVRIPPQVGRYKVFIIDEVHMLSPSAFNAFLKTLEEPPAHAIFILATTEKHKILPTILSRCQVYDFNRMNVQDIVSHLEYVAKNENIKAEPEALNVIAQKADGGMRDALSIFDQVASYTQGNITYDRVIQDLNVLDYEYYFKLTDAILTNGIPEILLTFNEILNKGFDGFHFLTGLGNHLRDLLVSKDESTLSLLQVSQNVREHYKEQASKCQPRFLYKALDICNTCEINYRVSNNKKFLVEVALIQLAQITDKSDEEEAGRKPDKIKPIFNKQQADSPQATQTQSKVSPKETAIAPPSASIQTTEEHQVPIAKQQKKSNIPIIKNISELGGVSLHPQVRHDEVQKQNLAPITQIAPSTEDHLVNERDINIYWREYAKNLPQEQNALAGRMQAIQVKQLKTNEFEVVVDNAMTQRDIQKVILPIQLHLRQKLTNSKITLTVRVSKEHEVTRAYTRTEKYQQMIKKNPELENLKNTFDLEFN